MTLSDKMTGKWILTIFSSKFYVYYVSTNVRFGQLGKSGYIEPWMFVWKKKLQGLFSVAA